MISYEKQENAHPGKSQPVYRLIIALRSIFDQSFFLPCSAPPAQHHANRTAAFICCQTDISTHYCQMQLYPQQIRSARCTQKHENSSEDHRTSAVESPKPPASLPATRKGMHILMRNASGRR